ncbi:S8 family serine peptidase [Caldifermentibacillus hisashii]|uniref:S8 family serine peptidase n=1 Tax=Caldifermentibacillus hisashii TaxID=996558 RepID=UPI003D194765
MKIARKCFVLCLIFSIFVLSAPINIKYVYAGKYERPALPQDEDTQQTVIVKVNKPMTESEAKQLLQSYPDLKLRYHFQKIFNGFSVMGPSSQIKKMVEKTSIENIYPSYTYELDISPYPQISNGTFNSINYIGTSKIRHLTDTNGNHLTGKGIKVGIIDTGIDYTHPDLRKSYVKGYDFVDNDHDPMETVDMGPNNTFHGTHVAGVIAANGKMTGVAPEAEIYAYRALGPGGFGTTEMIIAAVEQAIKDRVDVLNLSLGTSINGPDLPTSLALDKAVENGIVAVTSNGNSGPDLWTVGSPGTSHRAISVGASTPEIQIPYVDYYGQQFRLSPLTGSKPWNLDRSYKIVAGGLGREKDYQDIDVNGKIVLLKRGKLTFSDKVRTAEKYGAKAVIIYNNEDEAVLGMLDGEMNLPVAFLSKKDGEHLLKLMETSNTPAKIVNKTEQDRLADFSSRGPVTFSWEIKPDVVAPGVAIESTVPGGYKPLAGTSMSAPHVAGASAILKQANPDWTPEQIKAVLMSTSKPLLNEANQLYQSFEQGAGRIQMEEALRTETIIQPAALQYGKVKGKTFEETKKMITVENVSDHAIRCTFSTPLRSDTIAWDLPSPFYLKPKEKKQITIGIEVKNQHKKNEIYNGFIDMHSGSQTIHIPYLYVVAEPDYPRIMQFSFEKSEREDLYKYETYLPGGADEFGIALFDPDTYRFIDYLDWEKNVRRGLITKTIKQEKDLQKGTYIAVAFAKKSGKEDFIEQLIEIQ